MIFTALEKLNKNKRGGVDNMKKFFSYQKGFTLIELLIVIVIIGILAGLLVTVINPAQQQMKAREAVLRANVEKGCLGLHACGSTTDDANNCDTKAEVGLRAIDGSPTGSTYYLTDAGTPGDADSSANAAATATVHYRGLAGTCRFQCAYDFNADAPLMYSGSVMEIPVGSTCLIGTQ